MQFISHDLILTYGGLRQLMSILHSVHVSFLSCLQSIIICLTLYILYVLINVLVKNNVIISDGYFKCEQPSVVICSKEGRKEI